MGPASRTHLKEILADTGARFVVLSDRRVEAAVRPRFLTDATWISVEAGEESKCVASLSRLWSQLVTLGLDRSSVIVAVGGGVVGDLAGFCAATFMRGVPFFLLPTSLLAMVDASVGGKVGIDLPEGKNLVGQFYPAQVVAVDPEVLSTLPEDQWAAGMAEVIKHGVLEGPGLWNSLLEFHPEDRTEPDKLNALLEAAVMVKVKVVREDPFEKTGLRATLNLGHSFGHAIEYCARFQMSHGDAVALGLLAGVRLSRALGLLEKDLEPELITLIKRWGLPTHLPDLKGVDWSWDLIAQALDRDKKNKDQKWCFILPRSVGSVTTVRDPDKELVRKAFETLRAGREAE